LTIQTQTPPWSKRLSKPIHIEIFGRSYALQGETDQDYAQELAAFVDAKMHEIAEHAKGSPYSKLVVLAAINIAHELFQLKNDRKTHEAIVGGKALGIIERIEEQFEAFHLKNTPPSRLDNSIDL